MLGPAIVAHRHPGLPAEEILEGVGVGKTAQGADAFGRMCIDETPGSFDQILRRRQVLRALADDDLPYADGNTPFARMGAFHHLFQGLGGDAAFGEVIGLQAADAGRGIVADRGVVVDAEDGKAFRDGDAGVLGGADDIRRANVVGGEHGGGRKWKLEAVELSDRQKRELDLLLKDMNDFIQGGEM